MLSAGSARHHGIFVQLLTVMALLICRDSLKASPPGYSSQEGDAMSLPIEICNHTSKGWSGSVKQGPQLPPLYETIHTNCPSPQEGGKCQF